MSNKKIIQTNSYDDSGPDLEARTLAHRDKQLAKGKKGHTLIFRNSTYAKDHLKFNALIGGIPLFLYNLHSLYRSGAKEVVTVGNNDTRKIHETYCKYFRLEGFKFVHEGSPDEWSFANTLRKGMAGHYPGYDFSNPEMIEELKEDVTVIVTGDTPYIDTDPMVSNSEISDYDFYWLLNAKEVFGPIVDRQHHLIIDGYGVKENNWAALKLEKLKQSPFGLGLFNKGFNARKIDSDGNPQLRLFKELAMRDRGEFSLEKTIKSFSILGIGWSIKTAFSYGKRCLLKIPENDDNMIKLDSKKAENFVSHALGIPGYRAKFGISPDPASALDIDSDSDVIYHESLLKMASETMYPHYTELKAFADNYVKRNGSWGCPFTDNWREFANKRFEKYGLRAAYNGQGLIVQQEFSEKDIRDQLDIIEKYRSMKSQSVKDKINIKLEKRNKK